MRDPATYRGNRRKRAKEIMTRETASAGERVTFPQAWSAISNAFARRKMWRVAPKAQQAG